MFGLMGNCFSCIKKRQGPRKEFTLAILGVDNAGKTTITKALIGEHLDTAPTVGFNSEKIKFGKYDITLYDLGGGVKIRDIWKNYFEELYGIIYMVDGSSSQRIEETRSNLHDLLEQKQVSGKPLLLLANKQDVKDALDEVDICQRLGLEELVNRNRCPCKIEACSAIKGTGRKIDKNIKKGLKWLATFIDHNFESLDKRIQEDKKITEEKRQIEREERRKRVEAIRKERQEKEAAEKEKLGIEDDENDDNDVIDGDPFKRIDISELEKKEKKMKEKTKKKQKMLEDIELQNHLDKNNHFKANSRPSDEFITSLSTPRTKRRSSIQLESQILESNISSKYHERGYNSDDCDNYTSNKTPNGKLPPIQSQIGTKFEEEKPVRKIKKKKFKPVNKNNLITEDLELNDSLPVNDSFMESKKSLRSVSKINVETRDDESSQEETVGTPHYISRTEDGNDSNLRPVKPVRKRKNKRFKHRLEGSSKSDMGSGTLSIGSLENHGTSRFPASSEKDDMSEASSTNIQLTSKLNKSTLPPVEPGRSFPYKRNSFDERFPVESTQDMYRRFKSRVHDVNAEVHSSPARSIKVKSLMLEENSEEELEEKRSDSSNERRRRRKHRFRNHSEVTQKNHDDDDDGDIIVGQVPRNTNVSKHDRKHLINHSGRGGTFGEDEYGNRGADRGMRNLGFAEDLDIDTTARLSSRLPNADCDDDIIT